MESGPYKSGGEQPLEIKPSSVESSLYKSGKRPVEINSSSADSVVNILNLPWVFEL